MGLFFYLVSVKQHTSVLGSNGDRYTRFYSVRVQVCPDYFDPDRRQN